LWLGKLAPTEDRRLIAVNLLVRRLARVYTKADATSSQTGRGGTADSFEPQQPSARDLVGQSMGRNMFGGGLGRLGAILRISAPPLGPSCPDGSK
jgi:hypothetical protein